MGKPKSNTKQPKEDTEGIISHNKMITKEEVLSTPESLLINNRKIFLDKLKNKYPNYEVIQDIGSEINFKRKGFKPKLNISGNHVL